MISFLSLSPPLAVQTCGVLLLFFFSCFFFSSFVLSYLWSTCRPEVITQGRAEERRRRGEEEEEGEERRRTPKGT